MLRAVANQDLINQLAHKKTNKPRQATRYCCLPLIHHLDSKCRFNGFTVFDAAFTQRNHNQVPI